MLQSLLSFLLIYLHTLTPGNGALEEITIPWSQVPLLPTTSFRQDNLEVESCLCDVTIGLCDMNCCCDTTCSTEEKASFSNCDLESKKGENVYCPSNTNKKGYYSRFSLDIFTRKLDRLLCIEFDNNPLAGIFYRNPLQINQKEVTSLYTVRAIPLPSPLSSPLSLPSPTPPSSTPTFPTPTPYRFHLDPVFLLSYSATEDLMLYHPLRLPVSSNRDCEFSLSSPPVKFMQNIDKKTCQKLLSPSLPDQCSQLFLPWHNLDSTLLSNYLPLSSPPPSVAQFLSYLSAPLSPLSPLSPIQITISHTDPLTNTTTTLPDPLPTLQQRAFLSTPSPSSCICHNVLQSAQLLFSYQPSSILPLSLSLTLSLTDVQSDCQSPPLPFFQSYSVQWVPSITPSHFLTSHSSTQLGYQNGKHLSAGTFVTSGSQKAVQLFFDTISHAILPARIGGITRQDAKCLLSGTRDDERLIPIPFNSPLSVSCRLEVSLTEFASLCRLGGTMGYQILQPEFNAIGLFNNATYVNPEDWYELGVADVGDVQGSFDGDRMECSGLVTSVVYRMVYGRQGSTLNPQNVFAGGQMLYQRSGVLRFVPSDNDFVNGKMGLILSASVQWLRMAEGDVQEYVPPSPVVLPKLPKDLFYPFEASGVREVLGGGWGRVFLYVMCAIGIIYLSFDL